MKKHIATVSAFMLFGAFAVGAQTAQTTTSIKPAHKATLPTGVTARKTTTPAPAATRKTVTPHKITEHKAVTPKNTSNNQQ
jgi:hypothetical protein